MIDMLLSLWHEGNIRVGPGFREMNRRHGLAPVGRLMVNIAHRKNFEEKASPRRSLTRFATALHLLGPSVFFFCTSENQHYRVRPCWADQR
ncbi:MAG: hypothetical protein Q8L92_03750, partial [Rubrivivax sp.]|nr:hypothetical protein [Rubrivivax sp.]